MAIPSIAPAGPGGDIFDVYKTIVGTRNALAKQAIENEYLPYTERANALSKLAYANYLPAQLKSTILSNPNVWLALKDNPDALKQMLTSFSSSITDAEKNAPQIPYGGTGDGLLSALLSKLISMGRPSSPIPEATKNPLGAPTPTDQSSANPFSNLPSSTSETNALNNASPLVPASRGSFQGAMGKNLAQFQQSPYKPGTVFADPNTGEIVSSPTSATVTAAQNAINAAKRVEPQLERLADEGAPFLSAKGIIGNQLQRVWNLFFPEKPGELPGKYAKFHSTLQAAPEALVKAYGLRPTNETIERMQKVIEPYRGETKEQYKSRMLEQLNQLADEQIGISSEQLSQGFNLTPKRKVSASNTAKAAIKKDADKFKSETILMIDPEGKIWHVPQGQSQLFLENGFKRT